MTSVNSKRENNSRPPNIAPQATHKLGVIGAGMMGQGIAYVAAKAGIEVVLKDMTLDAAEKGKAYSRKVSDKQIERGQMTAVDKEALLKRITPTEQDQDLQGCDLIIEAVFENMPLKQQITQTTEGYLSEEGVWATNTSSLPITQLAEASASPEQFIGLHFFSPVDRMKLVEIICGKKTSEATLAKAFDFVEQINKTPIVVNDALGFFTSRVFGVPLWEAATLVAEGVHPERIETLGKDMGMPVGPLTSFDEISLRLIVEIHDSQIEMGLRDPADDPCPAGTRLANQLLKDDKRGGRQYGGGFYEYSDTGKTLWPPLIEQFHQPDIDAAVSDQDIKDRLLFRAVIESLKCLEEGVLRSVSDGNIGSIYGIGAPKWTGGYIEFVNGYGLQRFIDRCDELTSRYGERFNAPEIARLKLEQGEHFE